MQNKLKVYGLRCCKLEKKLDILKTTTNNTEQSILVNNIDISGVHKILNENVCQVRKTVAQVLKCKVDRNNLNNSFREKSCQNIE